MRIALLPCQFHPRMVLPSWASVYSAGRAETTCHCCPISLAPSQVPTSHVCLPSPLYLATVTKSRPCLRRRRLFRRSFFRANIDVDGRRGGDSRRSTLTMRRRATETTSRSPPPTPPTPPWHQTENRAPLQARGERIQVNRSGGSNTTSPSCGEAL